MRISDWSSDVCSSDLRADLLGGTRAALVPDRDRSRQIAERDMVTAQLLQRHVGVESLVVGVGIEELSRFVVEHLPQVGDDGLALGKPLTAKPGHGVVGTGLFGGKEMRRTAHGCTADSYGRKEPSAGSSLG